MDILILLKANIKKKKGVFISILLLTAIVSSVMAMIFGVKDNYNIAIENSIKYADCGDIQVIISPAALTDELRLKVEEHELVERVVYCKSICANGISFGELYNGNSQFLEEMREGIRLINEDINGYADEIPSLESGEIYLTLGQKTNIGCDIGDTVTLDIFKGVTEEFKVKGFVEDITMGSANIGWKQVFISSEDYERILEECKPLETEDAVAEAVIMMISGKEEMNLSTTAFQRKLNLDTGIIASSYGTLNIEQSVHYTTILTGTVLNIVMAFVIILFVIVLIVMSHSIGTEIEAEYTTLGILKAQGFTEGKIRLVFIFQYALCVVLGIIAGIITAIPFERKISSLCQNFTGVISNTGFAVGKCLIFTTAILIVSVAVVCIKTIKISKISPVKAILGGREEIFFDSRINLPVTKKALSASLSLRQFTSEKKRYMGTIFIAAILTFCMITVNLTGNMLNSRKALASMGMAVYDLCVYCLDNECDDEWEEIERLIEKYSSIEEENGSKYIYASLNGENLFCELYKYPENISAILKGRAPLYENEIMVTEFVADLLEIKIGDEVTVAFKTKENSYIISGIYQSEHDTGMSFCMNYDGALRNGESKLDAQRTYVLSDKSNINIIAQEIEDNYADIFMVRISDENDTGMTIYNEIVSLFKLIIYAFSVLFAFVIIRMVVIKAFIHERTGIGIYKAEGFTSNMLRLQFAIRFLIVAVIGSAIGVLLSILLSEETLSLILTQTGMSKVVIEYTSLTLIIPIAVISLSFFVFSFLASRKIKSVEIKELITE